MTAALSGKVNWDKEMVLHADGYGAMIRQLRDVSTALMTLNMFLKPGDVENRARQTGNYDEVLYREVVRFEGACGQVRRTVESAVKSLIHVAGRPNPREIRGHIGELCAYLVEPYRGEIAAWLTMVGASPLISEEPLISRHELSRYVPDEEEKQPADAELVRRMATVACGVALYAADQVDENVVEVARINKDAATIARRLQDFNLATGEPLRRESPNRGLLAAITAATYPESQKYSRADVDFNRVSPMLSAYWYLSI